MFFLLYKVSCCLPDHLHCLLDLAPKNLLGRRKNGYQCHHSLIRIPLQRSALSYPHIGGNDTKDTITSCRSSSALVGSSVSVLSVGRGGNLGLGLVVVGLDHITGASQSIEYLVSDVVNDGPAKVTKESGSKAKTDQKNVQNDQLMRKLTVDKPAGDNANSTHVTVMFVVQVVVGVMVDTFTAGRVTIDHVVLGSAQDNDKLGINAMGVLDSILAVEQSETTQKASFDAKKAGSSHRIVELNLDAQTKVVKKESDKSGSEHIDPIALSLNETQLAAELVAGKADVSHLFIDNITVVGVLQAGQTRKENKSFPAIGEEGTRTVGGSPISLTNHEDSGHVVGETVAKTSKGEVKFEDTVTKYSLSKDSAAAKNDETVEVSGTDSLVSDVQRHMWYVLRVCVCVPVVPPNTRVIGVGVADWCLFRPPQAK